MQTLDRPTTNTMVLFTGSSRDAKWSTFRNSLRYNRNSALHLPTSTTTSEANNRDSSLRPIRLATRERSKRTRELLVPLPTHHLISMMQDLFHANHTTNMQLQRLGLTKKSQAHPHPHPHPPPRTMIAVEDDPSTNMFLTLYKRKKLLLSRVILVQRWWKSLCTARRYQRFIAHAKQLRKKCMRGWLSLMRITRAAKQSLLLTYWRRWKTETEDTRLMRKAVQVLAKRILFGAGEAEEKKGERVGRALVVGSPRAATTDNNMNIRLATQLLLHEKCTEVYENDLFYQYPAALVVLIARSCLWMQAAKQIGMEQKLNDTASALGYKISTTTTRSYIDNSNTSKSLPFSPSAPISSSSHSSSITALVLRPKLPKLFLQRISAHLNRRHGQGHFFPALVFRATYLRDMHKRIIAFTEIATAERQHALSSSASVYIRPFTDPTKSEFTMIKDDDDDDDAHHSPPPPLGSFHVHFDHSQIPDSFLESALLQRPHDRENDDHCNDVDANSPFNAISDIYSVFLVYLERLIKKFTFDKFRIAIQILKEEKKQSTIKLQSLAISLQQQRRNSLLPGTSLHSSSGTRTNSNSGVAMPMLTNSRNSLWLGQLLQIIFHFWRRYAKFRRQKHMHGAKNKKEYLALLMNSILVFHQQNEGVTNRLSGEDRKDIVRSNSALGSSTRNHSEEGYLLSHRSPIDSIWDAYIGRKAARLHARERADSTFYPSILRRYWRLWNQFLLNAKECNRVWKIAIQKHSHSLLVRGFQAFKINAFGNSLLGSRNLLLRGMQRIQSNHAFTSDKGETSSSPPALSLQQLLASHKLQRHRKLVAPHLQRWKMFTKQRRHLHVTSLLVQERIQKAIKTKTYHQWRMARRQVQILRVYQTSMLQGIGYGRIGGGVGENILTTTAAGSILPSFTSPSLSSVLRHVYHQPQIPSSSSIHPAPPSAFFHHHQPTPHIRATYSGSRASLTALQACLLLQGDPGHQTIFIQAWKQWSSFVYRRRTWNRMVFLYRRQYVRNVLTCILRGWKECCVKRRSVSEDTESDNTKTTTTKTTNISIAGSLEDVQRHFRRFYCQQPQTFPLDIDWFVANLQKAGSGEILEDDLDESRLCDALLNQSSHFSSHKSGRTKTNDNDDHHHICTTSPLHTAVEDCNELEVRRLLFEAAQKDGMAKSSIIKSHHHYNSTHGSHHYSFLASIVHAQDEEGNTPLHVAVKHFSIQYIGIVILLLECGASPSCAVNKSKQTAVDISVHPDIRNILHMHIKRIQEKKFTLHERQLYRVRSCEVWGEVFFQSRPFPSSPPPHHHHHQYEETNTSSSKCIAAAQSQLFSSAQFMQFLVMMLFALKKGKEFTWDSQALRIREAEVEQEEEASSSSSAVASQDQQLSPRSHRQAKQNAKAQEQYLIQRKADIIGLLGSPRPSILYTARRSPLVITPAYPSLSIYLERALVYLLEEACVRSTPEFLSLVNAQANETRRRQHLMLFMADRARLLLANHIMRQRLSVYTKEDEISRTVYGKKVVDDNSGGGAHRYQDSNNNTYVQSSYHPAHRLHPRPTYHDATARALANAKKRELLSALIEAEEKEESSAKERRPGDSDMGGDHQPLHHQQAHTAIIEAVIDECSRDVRPSMKLIRLRASSSQHENANLSLSVEPGDADSAILAAVLSQLDNSHAPFILPPAFLEVLAATEKAEHLRVSSSTGSGSRGSGTASRSTMGSANTRSTATPPLLNNNNNNNNRNTQVVIADASDDRPPSSKRRNSTFSTSISDNDNRKDTKGGSATRMNLLRAAFGPSVFGNMQQQQEEEDGGSASSTSSSSSSSSSSLFAQTASADKRKAKAGVAADPFSAKILLAEAEQRIRRMIIENIKLQQRGVSSNATPKSGGNNKARRRNSLDDILTGMFMVRRLREALHVAEGGVDPVAHLLQVKSKTVSATLAIQKSTLEARKVLRGGGGGPERGDGNNDDTDNKDIQDEQARNGNVGLMSASALYSSLIWSEDSNKSSDDNHQHNTNIGTTTSTTTFSPSVIDTLPRLYGWDLIRARLGLGYRVTSNFKHNGDNTNNSDDYDDDNEDGGLQSLLEKTKKAKHGDGDEAEAFESKWRKKGKGIHKQMQQVATNVFYNRGEYNNPLLVVGNSTVGKNKADRDSAENNVDRGPQSLRLSQGINMKPIESQVLLLAENQGSVTHVDVTNSNHQHSSKHHSSASSFSSHYTEDDTFRSFEDDDEDDQKRHIDAATQLSLLHSSIATKLHLGNKLKIKDSVQTDSSLPLTQSLSSFTGAHSDNTTVGKPSAHPFASNTSFFSLSTPTETASLVHASRKTVALLKLQGSDESDVLLREVNGSGNGRRKRSEQKGGGLHTHLSPLVFSSSSSSSSTRVWDPSTTEASEELAVRASNAISRRISLTYAEEVPLLDSMMTLVSPRSVLQVVNGTIESDAGGGGAQEAAHHFRARAPRWNDPATSTSANASTASIPSSGLPQVPLDVLARIVHIRTQTFKHVQQALRALQQEDELCGKQLEAMKSDLHLLQKKIKISTSKNTYLLERVATIEGELHRLLESQRNAANQVVDGSKFVNNASTTIGLHFQQLTKNGNHDYHYYQHQHGNGAAIVEILQESSMAVKKLQARLQTAESANARLLSTMHEMQKDIEKEETSSNTTIEISYSTLQSQLALNESLVHRLKAELHKATVQQTRAKDKYEVLLQTTAMHTHTSIVDTELLLAPRKALEEALAFAKQMQETHFQETHRVLQARWSEVYSAIPGIEQRRSRLEWMQSNLRETEASLRSFLEATNVNVQVQMVAKDIASREAERHTVAAEIEVALHREEERRNAKQQAQLAAQQVADAATRRARFLRQNRIRKLAPLLSMLRKPGGSLRTKAEEEEAEEGVDKEEEKVEVATSSTPAPQQRRILLKSQQEVNQTLSPRSQLLKLLAESVDHLGDMRNDMAERAWNSAREDGGEGGGGGRDDDDGYRNDKLNLSLSPSKPFHTEAARLYLEDEEHIVEGGVIPMLRHSIAIGWKLGNSSSSRSGSGSGGEEVETHGDEDTKASSKESPLPLPIHQEGTYDNTDSKMGAKRRVSLSGDPLMGSFSLRV